jgi:uncharacterized protein (UPF0261 family)
MVHNAQMTCFAPTPDEMVAAAREMIERLNRALGPTMVVIPSQGFSRPNQEGAPLYVPEGNAAVIEEFRATLRTEVPLIVADLHLNDPGFAGLVTRCLLRLIRGEGPHHIAERAR